MKKVMGLRKKDLIDTDISMVTTREKGGRREVEEGKGGINRDGSRFYFGW